MIQYGHLVIALLILLERLALPVPVSPLLVVSGALAGMGRLSFPVILITATVASMAGDLFWYELGRHRGNRILSFLCRISLDPESCIRKAKGIFARIGTRSIVVARFIPGLSTFGPPLAGVFQMKTLHFLLLDSLGTSAWAALFAGLGYQFAHQLESLAFEPTGLRPWAGLLLPTGMAAYLLWKYLQRKRFLRHLAIARITPEEVKQRLDAGEDIVVLDLRDSFEFREKPQTIPGAFQISIEELESQHPRIPRDREIVLFCN